MSNNTQTLTLTEFLLVRIAEDEARWQMLSAAEAMRATAAFLLAECEAKRQIVAEVAEVQRLDDRTAIGSIAAAHGWRILRHVATVYADHPDYRQEWRP